jgi:putative component of toxin-antitoxin plasmid stabilization module
MVSMNNKFETEVYKTSTEKEPFTEGEESLDQRVLARIDARITRIESSGNFGICEPVGEVFLN